MAIITLTKVTFQNPQPTAPVSVSIHYKKVGEPDSAYVLHNSGATVLADGNFSPVQVINIADESVNYLVRVTMNCSTANTVQEFNVSAPVVVYGGWKLNNSVLTPSQIEASTQGTVVPGGTVTIDYTANAQPRHLWMAEPINQPIKTVWYTDATNSGDIGTDDDLFGAPVISGGYRFYISVYPTANTDYPMQFRVS